MNVATQRGMRVQRSIGGTGGGKQADTHSMPWTIANTAAKDSWKDTENSEGGCTIRMDRAAAARLFLRSVRRSASSAVRNTTTMANERCVDGENPATRAYATAGPIVSS